jgi:hypothetical protein
MPETMAKSSPRAYTGTATNTEEEFMGMYRY